MLAMKAHTSGKRRKRPVNKTNELGEQAGSEAGYPKRPKIQPKPEPGVADTACVDEDSPSSPAQCPPLSGYDLDRLNYHVDLEDFGKGLQNAANAVFSSDQRSRYTQVSALLLSWEDEDPQLPVSLEINALKDVLVNLYEFEVEEWKIPTQDSHMELNLKILQFLKDSSTKHLKIVYYAGHGKLSNHGQAIWTSHRNSVRNGDRYPTVKWSGIQNALEESHSDVLILLDCCASGMSNTDEGNGVTELIAACAFNNTANGVGPFSFTHALVAQLRKLVHMPSFNVGYLYNLLFTEIQSLRIEDAQRKKAPVHLVLTQDHRLPRSITISANMSRILSSLGPLGGSGSLGMSPTPQPGSSSESPNLSEGSISLSSGSGASPATSMSELPEYPRLLFSIRLSEDIKPTQLSTELFADWLGTIPIDTKSVRIEAGFASDSTLLMVSLPIAMLGYLPDDPAITMLGVIRSANLLTWKEEDSSTFKASVASAKDEKGEVPDIHARNDGLTKHSHTWELQRVEKNCQDLFEKTQAEFTKLDDVVKDQGNLLIELQKRNKNLEERHLELEKVNEELYELGRTETKTIREQLDKEIQPQVKHIEEFLQRVANLIHDMRALPQINDTLEKLARTVQKLEQDMSDRPEIKDTLTLARAVQKLEQDMSELKGRSSSGG